MGDIDGDGSDDLLVGAPNYSTAASEPYNGRAVLYSGTNGTVLRTHEGPRFVYRSGFAVAGVGDCDHDGIPTTRSRA